MDNKKYFELQKEAQLSNTQSAALFDVGISTIKRWRNGSVKAPKAVLMVLEFTINKKNQK